MPIKFRCSCGKVMQAKEENAGSRCKCIGCGATLVIPTAPSVNVVDKRPAPIADEKKIDPAATIGYSPAESKVPPSFPSIKPPAPPSNLPPPTAPLTPVLAPPMSPPSARPPSALPATDALKTIPHLEGRESLSGFSTLPPPPPPPPTPFPTPANQSMIPTVSLPPATQETDVPWYQVDPREERRKQRRVRLLLYAGAFLFVAGLAAGVWFAVAMLTGSSRAPEDKGPPGLPQLTMVPRDAPFFVTIRVADLWSAKALAKTRTEFNAKFNSFLEGQFGLKMEDIDRFTFVIGEVPSLGRGPAGMPHFWMVVHTQAKFDPTRMREKLLVGAVEKRFGEKTLYVVRDMGVYFASDKEVCLGWSPSLESILSGDRKIALDGPVKDSVDLAAQNRHHLVAAMYLPETFKAEMQRAPNFPEVARPFLDMTGGSIAFNADSEKGGDLVCRFNFTKPESARDGAAFVRFAIAGGKDELRKLPPGGPDQAKVIDQTMRLLNQSKVEEAGTSAVVTVSGASESLGPLLEALIPLLEREFRAPAFLP